MDWRLAAIAVAGLVALAGLLAATGTATPATLSALRPPLTVIEEREGAGGTPVTIVMAQLPLPGGSPCWQQTVIEWTYPVPSIRPLADCPPPIGKPRAGA